MDVVCVVALVLFVRSSMYVCVVAVATLVCTAIGAVIYRPLPSHDC